MGIPRGSIKLLMKIGKETSFSDLSILTIGRMDIWGTYTDVKKWAAEMGYSLKSNVEITLTGNNNLRGRGYISDTTFFKLMGFGKLDSLDYDNYQGCSIIHDLNVDISPEFYNKYDLILDGGTSEHVFNIPKVLENYNRMLKAGGLIIHGSPSSNYVDHGFYMFSPTLFFDYYSANKWEIKNCYFFKLTIRHYIDKWKIYEYTPGGLSKHLGLLRGMWGLFFVARKTEEATFDSPVQQGRYVSMWNASSKKDSATNETNNKTYLRKSISRLLPLSIKLLIYSYYMRFAPLPLRFIGRY